MFYDKRGLILRIIFMRVMFSYNTEKNWIYLRQILNV